MTCAETAFETLDFTRANEAKAMVALASLRSRAGTGRYRATVRIGPAFARACLAGASNVRATSSATVRGYASTMSKGLWTYNPDPICFERTSGQMANAFHRLTALSTCADDVSVEFDLLFGLTAIEIENLDQGKKRKQSDVLGRRVEEVAVVRSALTCMTLRQHYENYTKDDVKDGLVRFAAALRAFDSAIYHDRIPASVFGPLLCLHGAHPAKVVEFANQLRAPSTVEGVHSSVRLLRDALVDMRKRGTAGQRGAFFTSLYTMIAVRAFIDGRPVKTLRNSILEKDCEVKGVAFAKGSPSVLAWFAGQVL